MESASTRARAEGRTDKSPPRSTSPLPFRPPPNVLRYYPVNYKKSSARARFFPRASSGAAAATPASDTTCAGAASVFASGADASMSLAK